METMYVQSNETGLVVAIIRGADHGACERAMESEYGSNDYSAGYSDYRNEPRADDLREIDADKI